jgi:hypothetical protein
VFLPTTDPGGTKRFQKETGSQIPANPGACCQSHPCKSKIESMMAELTRINLRRTIRRIMAKGKPLAG